MAIEVNAAAQICTRCGMAYGRRKGYFPVNYGSLYKGIGYLSVCKTCVDSIYNKYLSECSDVKKAVRQTCRKLDLYWSDSVYDVVVKKNTQHTIMTAYIAKINTPSYVGKSYDDSLNEYGTLWLFNANDAPTQRMDTIEQTQPEEQMEDIEIDDSVKEFWGPGYTNDMYDKLEKRRSFWLSGFPDNGSSLDVGTEALIRQICSLELDINRDRMAGKSVDKSVNALNTLLGSAALKPTQNKTEESDSDLATVPFGVWIKRWENYRPTPDIDEELKDVDGIIKYICIWFFGHLAKMLGIKNAYSKLYEDKIAEMRIERPEYEDESDEDMVYDIFSGNNS